MYMYVCICLCEVCVCACVYVCVCVCVCVCVEKSLPGNYKPATAVPATLGIKEKHIREEDTKFENSPHPGVYCQKDSLIQL